MLFPILWWFYVVVVLIFLSWGERVSLWLEDRGDGELILLLHKLFLWFFSSNALHIGHILMLLERLHVLFHMLLVMILLLIIVFLMIWVDDILYCWLMSLMDSFLWWGYVFVVTSMTYFLGATINWFFSWCLCGSRWLLVAIIILQ